MKNYKEIADKLRSIESRSKSGLLRQMTIERNMLARKLREVEESKDPFYNEANQNRLNKTIAAYENREE